MVHELPLGASSLQVASGTAPERFSRTDRGIADTEPVRPGPTSLETRLSYELPYQEGQSLVRSFGLPVTSVALILVGDGLVINGPGVVPAGTTDTEFGPAAYYTAGPLTTDEPLEFAVVSSGAALPSSDLAQSTQARDSRSETAVGIAVLALALGAVALLLRSAGSGAAPPNWAMPSLKAIASLDAQYDSSTVDLGTYRDERKRLVQDLLARYEALDD